MAISSTATGRRSALSTAGCAAGCGASCGGSRESGGSRRRTEPIRHAGQMLSLPNMGCSACKRRVMRSASPLEGKTTDWRAGCGRPASPVRRAGRATFPTPIHGGWSSALAESQSFGRLVLRDDRDLTPYVSYAGQTIAQMNNMYVSRGCKSEMPWNYTPQPWVNLYLQHIYDACVGNSNLSVILGVWNLHYELR